MTNGKLGVQFRTLFPNLGQFTVHDLCLFHEIIADYDKDRHFLMHSYANFESNFEMIISMSSYFKLFTCLNLIKLYQARSRFSK